MNKKIKTISLDIQKLETGDEQFEYSIKYKGQIIGAGDTIMEAFKDFSMWNYQELEQLRVLDFNSLFVDND